MSGKPPKIAVHPVVFFTSGSLLLAFLAFGVFAKETAAEVLPKALDAVASYFGWFYILAVAFFIGFSVWLLFTPYAKIRLGPDDSRPEYSTLTWFSMLFSAGMGIGLLFYGNAQPIQMYQNPPTGTGNTLEAARLAVPNTFLHWGLHAWAIYVVMGLAIAYFAYRKGLPIAIRSTFYPIMGERIYGRFGDMVDIIAVFGTLFGLATSLGLGAAQVNAGLNHLFGVSQSETTQLILIAIITGAATVSLVTGVDKGIRRLSELNMLLAGLLMLFVFVTGPTLFILGAFPENIGAYLDTFLEKTFWMGTFEGRDWNQAWTIFFWGWWIAWAPFVGMFVARISKGRTIREFVLGVLLVPTLVTFTWFTVFGDTALYLELHGGGGISAAVKESVPTAIYVMLEKLPLGSVTSLLAACVVAVFFVTSSDSASFVVDMLTSGGHPNPPIWQRVFWAVAEGATAAVLLVAAGKTGLKALQAGVTCIGAPFCVLMVFMCFNLVRALSREPLGDKS